MRRLLLALIAIAITGGVARAQADSVTGACAKPDTIIFRGNNRITDGMLRGDAGITPGTQLNYRALQRAIKALYATGQFEDVAVTCEAVGGRTGLAFAVRERPLLGEVAVEGVDRLSSGAVRDRVDLLIGRPIDPSQVAKSVARIDSMYEAAGYTLARIRVDTTQLTGNQARLVFHVDEGRRLAVSGVRIVGNQAISSKTIVGAMKTSPEGFFWWKKGEFDEDAFAADVTERIPQLYAQHGYIDAQVIRDTLIVDRERGKALVELTVAEGPQYHIGDFEVTGATRFPRDVIAAYYPFGDRGRTLSETVKDVLRLGGSREEDVFDRSAWDDATQKLQQAYATEGYIYANIRPVVDRRFAGPDSTPTVDLRWEIDERTPAIVNRIEIMGNDITNESCIRDQILMLPGDVFNQQRLVASYQSIANLGFFETPLPAPETRPDERGDVDIVFRVKEKHTGNVNFGASVGQGYGVGGFIGFDQPNLFGMCKRGSLQWQFGKYINDFSLSYTDPRIRESRISGSVTAYHRQSRFTIGNIGRTIQTGGQFRLGFPVLGSRWTRLFVDYSGERVRYGSDGLVGTAGCSSGTSKSNCFRSSVGLTLDRDTRFDMPFPSTGVHQSLSASFNGGPLGGSAAFQRYVAEMRSYATLATMGGSNPGSQPIKLVFGLSSRAGALFGNPGPFFVSQSFSLGGVQYGEPLRGYEEFSITPRGYLATTDTYSARLESFGNAFFTGTAEMGLRFNQQLYVNAFYDVGNIWERPRDFNPTRLFRGAGFGASLVTPLGPLGIDLGYGFDRVDASGRRDPKWQVHFKFGQIF